MAFPSFVSAQQSHRISINDFFCCPIFFMRLSASRRRKCAQILQTGFPPPACFATNIHCKIRSARRELAKSVSRASWICRRIKRTSKPFKISNAPHNLIQSGPLRSALVFSAVHFRRPYIRRRWHARQCAARIRRACLHRDVTQFE